MGARETRIQQEDWVAQVVQKERRLAEQEAEAAQQKRAAAAAVKTPSCLAEPSPRPQEAVGGARSRGGALDST